MEFKGTKELKILRSNELGFSLGKSDIKTRITFWGVDSETKANILLILKAPEMLEMLQKISLMTETCTGTFQDFRERYNLEINQLIKEATTLNTNENGI